MTGILIFIGSIAGCACLGYIGYLLYGYFSKVADKFKYRKSLKSYLKNKEYDSFIRDIKTEDIGKLYSIKRYLDCLFAANLALNSIFYELRHRELLVSPAYQSDKSVYYLDSDEALSISSNVGLFISNLTKRYIDSSDVPNCRLLYEIIRILIDSFYTKSQPGGEAINQSFSKLNDFLASKENIDESEKLSIIFSAKICLGIAKTRVSEREQKMEKELAERSLREVRKSEQRKSKEELDNLKNEKNAIIRDVLNKYKSLKNEYAEKTKELKKASSELENVSSEYEKFKSSLRIVFDNYKDQMNGIIDAIKSNNRNDFFRLTASAIADVKTVNLQTTANALNWGFSEARLHKVASILRIRRDVKEQLANAQLAFYQLNYLLQLFPSLQNVLDSECNSVDLDISGYNYLDQDPVRLYLTNDEWKNLSTTKRNQLALDRYVSSHSKNNWEIGRDYELYIGQRYMKDGYEVDFTGSYMGLEDMGRDLICKKDGKVTIIQCKYWSRNKTIHENHISQLYGTLVCYCIENNKGLDTVRGKLITNTSLSETARKFADILKLDVEEQVQMDDFPRIKCNIGVDENGKRSKIYHLPMDLNYDSAKITKDGEFFAYTVKEAERKGFRRAYRWHGNSEE